MTNSYYQISLNIQEHASHVILKAKRGDTGRLLYIILMDGRNPYVLTDECRAVFKAKKPDGKTLYNSCSIIDHVICYAFTPQTTSSVGRSECEIKVYGSDNKLLTSAQFTLIVDEEVYDEDAELVSEKEFTELTDVLYKSTALVNTVEKKLANGDFNGPQGASGVIVPVKGFFALELDNATGGLYCITEDNASAPTFTLEDGKLYYEIEEV